MQEQFTPNAPVRILRKNPNYWNAGQPKADCLRITVAQEAVAAVSAIKAGQVDLDAQRRSIGHRDAQGRSVRSAAGDRRIELDDDLAWIDTQALRRRPRCVKR